MQGGGDAGSVASNSRVTRRTQRWLRVAAAGLAASVVSCSSCNGGGPEPRRACLTVTASPNLNLYDEQPHALTLYLYPLVGSLGFEQASVSDLLEGVTPPGVAGPRVAVTVGPGEQVSFEEAFPEAAAYMGVVAGYYRSPDAAEGSRRAVLPARCGLRTPEITLSPRDLLVN